MKARIPSKTTMQQLIDEADEKATTNAIKLCHFELGKGFAYLII